MDASRAPSLVETRAALPGGRLFDRQVRTALGPQNYGIEWCLTDLIRLRYEDASRLVDVLAGGAKPDPALRVQLPVPLRTVYPLAVEVWGCAPDPESEPPARMVDAAGVRHHHPSQWISLRRASYGPGQFELPAVSDVPWGSALWLLSKFGWRARDGGAEKRRFVERNMKQRRNDPDAFASEDQWQVVECAYEKLHPDQAPQEMGASPLEALVAQAARPVTAPAVRRGATRPPAGP